MDLSIIIVSYNTKELTLSCIDSIKKNTKGIDYEIIVVDNDSKDGSKEALARLEAKDLKIVINKESFGFAAANNQGLKLASGKYILFLNSDTKVLDNTLKEMVLWMSEHPKAGVVTCKLVGRDGNLQPTGGYFPSILSVFSWMTIQDLPLIDKIIKPFHPMHTRSFFSRGEDFYDKTKKLDWVTGAFLLARKDILDKVGGWDETYFMYVEEVDLCYRVKNLDWQIWYLPKWRIIHYGGASSKQSDFPLLSEYESIKKFYKKFYPSWQYPILRLFLKIGALGRIIVFAILEGKEGAKTYVKAFKQV